MKIRYYADAPVEQWHDRTLDLMGTISDVHDIAVEIDRIVERYGPLTGFPGTVRETTARAVYERDLKNNRALIDTNDCRPSHAYKRHGVLEVAGNIAAVDKDGTVRWASTRPGYADGYGPGAQSHTAMDFLEDLATSPRNRICVECLDLLDGDERFCPNCGRSLR